MSDAVEMNNVDVKQDPKSDTIISVTNSQDLRSLEYLSDSLSALKENTSNAVSHCLMNLNLTTTQSDRTGFPCHLTDTTWNYIRRDRGCPTAYPSETLHRYGHKSRTILFH